MRIAMFNACFSAAIRRSVIQGISLAFLLWGLIPINGPSLSRQSLCLAEDSRKLSISDRQKELAQNRRRQWGSALAGRQLEPHWFTPSPELQKLVPAAESTPATDADATSREPVWFWYLERKADNRKQFWFVSASQGVKFPVFSNESLAKALSEELKKTISIDQLPFDELSISGDDVQFKEGNQAFAWSLTKSELRSIDLKEFESIGKQASPHRNEGRNRHQLSIVQPLRQPGQKGQPRQREGSSSSPDERYAVNFENWNVVLEDRQQNRREVITKTGTAKDRFGSQVWWSPDSRHFVLLQTKEAQQHLIHHVESSPKDRVEPKLHSQQYLKPGDEIEHPRPRLFSAVDFREIPVSDELFPVPWSIQAIRWLDDSSAFRFLYNQRGHGVLRVVEVNTAGEVSLAINEECATFFDYTNKLFYLPVGENEQEILWASERSGYNHLYRIKAKSSEPALPVTQGRWVVRGIEHADQQTGTLWLKVSGYHPAQDPYFLHAARVNSDGTGFTVLTESDGHHSWSYSPNRDFLVTTWSRVDHPPVHELRDGKTGRKIVELGRVDPAPLLAKGWNPPARFVAKGRDGVTDIYGVLFFPSWSPMSARPEMVAESLAKRTPPKWRGSHTFPIVEQIYAGPHGSFVPRDFDPGRYQHFLAELGFVIVQIDGMGTNHRSKAFHDVCWKNLVDSGFPDRKLWIQAAAKTWPKMDLTRVGIFGGSAGGQSSTQAVLHHHDFYKVAVSDCGCHDNRMDKIWWNEMWMSWPIGKQYEEQSNVTNAHRLGGKLLLIVGERDENVDPASTMQVVNALIKADKDFDLLVIPGTGHGAAETPYGSKRRLNFLIEHLQPQGEATTTDRPVSQPVPSNRQS